MCTDEIILGVVAVVLASIGFGLQLALYLRDR